MKTTILVALLVGIAVAVSDRDYPSYRRGKDYIYQLNSQALTGIPHLSTQFTGFKINTQVTLQISDGNKAALQCDNIHFWSLNSVLNELPTDAIVPDSQWQELEPEQQELYENCLREPVKFRYEQGIVSDLEVAQEEPEWCTNLKKGVLSLFQLDFSQQQQIQDVDPKLADIIQQNHVSWDKSYDKTYRTMERAIDGDCESVYVVQEPHEFSLYPGEKDMKVMKIRNYDNCRMRPASEEGMFSTYVVDVENPHNQTGVRSYCHTNASIQGDRTDFVIKNLMQQSKHFYTPLSEEDGEVATFSVQELKVQDVRDTVSAIQPTQQTRQCPEGLQITLKSSQRSELGKPYTSNTDYSEERRQAIDDLLTEYVSKCTPAVTEEALEILPKIMYSLRECSSEDIMEELKNLRQQEEQSRTSEETISSKKMKTLIDLLPTVGRPQILPVVKQLIKDQYVSPMQAAAIFNYIALTIKPTAEVVEYLLPSSDLFHLTAVESSSQLRQTIILALGTVQHGLIKAQKAEPIPQAEFDRITKKFQHELEDLFKRSSLEEDKITVLKAIGNCGLPNFISFVEKVLQNERTPVQVRMNAVFALGRMPQDYEKKIHAILLPIFTNQNNEQDVRCLAYLIIMTSHPSYGIVQAIVSSLKQEKSQEVGAFVYSHLKDTVDSSRLSLNETRRHVRLTMKQAKPFIPKGLYRNTYSLDVLAKNLGIGQYLDVYVTDSPRTVFPNGIFASFGQTLYGRELNILQGGMQFSGVEEIVNRLVGPKSILNDLLDEDTELSKEILEIIKELLLPQQTSDMGKVDELVNNIIQKLGLSERDQENFKSGGFLKVLGNEIRFMIVNSPDIVSWIEENKRYAYDMVRTVMEKLRNGYQANFIQTISSETSVVIPTQLGIPLYFNGSYSHILRLTGNVQLTGNPFGRLESDKMMLDANLNPSAALMMKGSIGLQLPLLRSGVEVKTSLKIQGQSPVIASYQPQSKTLSVKYNIPNDAIEFIRFEAVPTTYITKLYTVPSAEVYECQAKEISNPKLVKPVSIKVPCESKTFGVKLEHNFQIPTPIVNFAPIRPFNGKHVYVCEKSTSSADQYVQMKFQYSVDKSDQVGIYRTASRSEGRNEDITSAQWKPVEADPILSQPTRRVLFVSVQTKNTPTERNAQSQITLITDTSYRCQLNIQATEENCRGKLNTNIVTDLQKIVFPEREEPKEELVVKCEIGYGKDSDKDYYGSVKVVTGDRNAKLEVPAEPQFLYKMRQWLQIDNIVINGDVIEQTSSQEGSAFYSRFGKSSSSYTGSYDNMQDDKISRGTTSIPEAMPYAYKYTIDINYQQLPQSVQQYAQYVYQYVKSQNQDISATKAKQQSSSTGTLQVYARFFPQLERMHLFVDAPASETVFFCPAIIPSYLKRALTLESALIEPTENEGRLMSNRARAKCTIEENRVSAETTVKTFDQLSYNLPELTEDCEIVIAKDCTPSRLFTVLMSKKEDSKKITILLPGSQIEVLVSQGWMGSNTQVQINGQQVSLTEGERYARTIDINNKPVTVLLTKKGDTINIELERIGLNLSCNQKKIQIQSNPLHSGQVCGICGDYNGDVQRELTGARQVLHSEAKQFALSYVVPSARCDVAELRRQHNTNQQTDSCRQPEKRTIIPRYQDDDNEVTCLSIQPVNQCPRHCEPVEERTERVAFHCLPINSPYTRRLVQDSQQRPLYELASKDFDRFVEITIQDRCRPRYY